MSSPKNYPHEQRTTVSESSPIQESQMNTTEQFPPVRGDKASTSNPPPDGDRQSTSGELRQRGDSSTSTFGGKLRSASRRFEESNLPMGMWDATATIASSIPSLKDIRRGSFGSEGWSAEGQKEERERRMSIARRRSSQTEEGALQRPSLVGPRSPERMRTSGSTNHQDNLQKVADNEKAQEVQKIPSADNAQEDVSAADREKDGQFTDGISSNARHNNKTNGRLSPNTSTAASQYMTEPFENGYHFPPKHTWTESTMIFLIGFWNYTTTWQGFLVVIYMLNIVAWGGMIFLLLCNAAPAMCYPTCDDINSPRRIWIEYDAQILTALFCVTGFGLIPWRFRDLYYLLKYRLKKDQIALRRLAGIHRDWFRLSGSQELPVLLGPDNVESEAANYSETSLPYPLKSIPNAPLTGRRAPQTPVWKLDYVIWMFVWNTFLQAVLSGIMWGLNRYDRPSWATGLFVALACIVAACGGIMIFVESKKVKKVEGVPVSVKDQERLKKDEEVGILHVNNIKDAIPKEKQRKTKMSAEGFMDGIHNGNMSNKIAR